MDEETRDAALLELQRATAKSRRNQWRQLADKIYQSLFKQQRWLIDDPHRLKSLLCRRQVGKTWSLVAYAVIVALRKPGANILLVAKTREAAQRIFWNAPDGLMGVNERFGLGGSWVGFPKLEFTFPNGSVITLRPCEDEADGEPVRGSKFDLVIIDETKSIRFTVLDYFVNECLRATLAVRKGTLVLAGTPGDVLSGLFYDVTGHHGQTVSDGKARSRPYAERDEEKWHDVQYSWSFHRWSAEDNVFVPHLWDSFQDIKKENGWSDDNPIWMREYLGLWVQDGGRGVYRFDKAKNLWSPVPTRDSPLGLPLGHEWRFVIGFDPGVHDATAVEAFAFSDTHPDAFHVYEFHRKVPISEKWIEEIKRAIAICEQVGVVETIIGDLDQLGDALIAQWAEEHSLFVEKSKKRDKRDHIEIANSELHEGRIKLMESSDLVKQLPLLQWDETGLKERSSQPNDCCDAFVYVWRASRHYYGATPAPTPPERVPGTDEFKQRLLEERNEKFDREARDAERSSSAWAVSEWKSEQSEW